MEEHILDSTHENKIFQYNKNLQIGFHFYCLRSPTGFIKEVMQEKREYVFVKK